jgi:hypothetical protein
VRAVDGVQARRGAGPTGRWHTSLIGATYHNRLDRDTFALAAGGAGCLGITASVSPLVSAHANITVWSSHCRRGHFRRRRRAAVTSSLAE